MSANAAGITASRTAVVVACLAVAAGCLVFLHKNRNERDGIYPNALVRGLDGEVSSNSLEVHVSSIRRKRGRQLLETVRGLGYRMPA